LEQVPLGGASNNSGIVDEMAFLGDLDGHFFDSVSFLMNKDVYIRPAILHGDMLSLVGQ